MGYRITKGELHSRNFTFDDATFSNLKAMAGFYKLSLSAMLRRIIATEYEVFSDQQRENRQQAA